MHLKKQKIILGVFNTLSHIPTRVDSIGESFDPSLSVSGVDINSRREYPGWSILGTTSYYYQTQTECGDGQYWCTTSGTSSTRSQHFQRTKKGSPDFVQILQILIFVAVLGQSTPLNIPPINSELKVPLSFKFNFSRSGGRMEYSEPLILLTPTQMLKIL